MRTDTKTRDSRRPAQRGPLVVQLVGRTDHRDFCDAIALIRADAAVARGGDAGPSAPPNLIIVMEDRPGAVSRRQVQSLRRREPLAGILALAGSWCEGEPRTGRPLAGAARLYWYEFPAWWRRQVARWSAGLCPEWAMSTGGALAGAADRMSPLDSATEANAVRRPALIALSTAWWETSEALADMLECAGYAMLWQRPGDPWRPARGLAAGIWEGGQLDEREAASLREFCRRLARAKAPAIALLDFPRRDAVSRALELGASAVLAKPWRNADLLETIAWTLARKDDAEHKTHRRAA
jgi:hypothetical protein